SSSVVFHLEGAAKPSRARADVHRVHTEEPTMSTTRQRTIFFSIAVGMLSLGSLDCAMTAEDKDPGAEDTDALKKGKCSDFDLSCQLKNDPAVKARLDGVKRAEPGVQVEIAGGLYAERGYLWVPYYDAVVGGR